MKKRIEQHKIGPTDRAKAKEIDTRVAEIVEHHRSMRDELMELPRIVFEFRRRRLWTALGYRTFQQWTEYRFRGSYFRIYPLLKIGALLQDVPRQDLALLGKTRAFLLARLRASGASLNGTIVNRFRQMKVMECQDYVNRRLGLRGSGVIWFGGFHASIEAAREITAGRRVARNLGFASVGDAERAAWRAFRAFNGAMRKLPKPVVVQKAVVN